MSKNIMIFENSPDTNSNPSTCSAVAIPASPSAKPENEPESPTSAIFGQSSGESFAYLDPDTSCWKTYPGIFPWGSDLYSETFPDSGTMRSGVVFELRTSGPAISGSGSSLWPTAAASVANDGETLESWDARKERNLAKHCNGNGMGTPLTIAATRWPTIRSAEAGDYQNQRDGTMQPTLTGAAKIWATPNAHDGRRPGSDATSTQGANLKRDAELWQTPAADSFRSRGGDRKDEMGLDQQARYLFSLPDHPIHDGPQSSPITPGLRRLSALSLHRGTLRRILRNGELNASLGEEGAQNGSSLHLRSFWLALRESHGRKRLSPAFVSWLMGFPIQHTETPYRTPMPKSGSEGCEILRDLTQLCKTEPSVSKHSAIASSRKSRSTSEDAS